MHSLSLTSLILTLIKPLCNVNISIQVKNSVGSKLSLRECYPTILTNISNQYLYQEIPLEKSKYKNISILIQYLHFIFISIYLLAETRPRGPMRGSLIYKGKRRSKLAQTPRQFIFKNIFLLLFLFF